MAGLHGYAQRIYDDPLLEDLRDAGVLDPSYSSVIHALRTGVTKEMVLKTTENPCREYAGVWERLGVLDEREDSLLTLDVSRIVVPASQRSQIMDMIHLAHQGQTKSYTACRSRYYWQNMKEDILRVTAGCDTCTELNPHPDQNPPAGPRNPKGRFGAL